MPLLNGTQRIVVANDIKIVGDNGFIVCEGRTIDECIANLMAKLKQEYLRTNHNKGDVA